MKISETYEAGDDKLDIKEEYTVEGLRITISIIDDEMEYAKKVNPIMALGMEQIRKKVLEQINFIITEGVK